METLINLQSLSKSDLANEPSRKVVLAICSFSDLLDDPDSVPEKELELLWAVDPNFAAKISKLRN